MPFFSSKKDNNLNKNIDNNINTYRSHSYMSDFYRPQFHLTPEMGWMNDPNGLVYYDGEYHMFYQYNPQRVDFPEPQHWGHAVSTDMLHWKHLEPALYPDDGGFMFSGCCVIDTNNTAGFGYNAMIAMYTRHNNDREEQCIAYSLDRGRTFTKYAGNPVIASTLAPNNDPHNFRDPKVIWDDERSRWVVCIAGGNQVVFYYSNNLKDWTYLSNFIRVAGSGVVECTNFAKIKSDDGKTKWVLMLSSQGAPQGGGGIQCYVGDFDGTTFKADDSNTPQWLDYGRDYYASTIYTNCPDNNVYICGWITEFGGATLQSYPFRGIQSILKKMTLKNINGKYVVLQEPVSLKSLRLRKKEVNNKVINNEEIELCNFNLAETNVTFNLNNCTANKVGLKVKAQGNEYVKVGYEVKTNKLFIDRTNCLTTMQNMSKYHEITVLPNEDNTIDLKILVDNSVIEVFAKGGEYVMTDNILSSLNCNGIVAFAEGGQCTMSNFIAYELNSIFEDAGYVHTNLNILRKDEKQWCETTEGLTALTSGNSFALLDKIADNGTYSAKLKITKGNACGIIFNCNAECNSMYLINVDTADKALNFYKVINNNFTLIERINENIEVNVEYKLKVEMNNGSFKIYLDDALKIDKQDKDLTNGYLGLYSFNSRCNFNNVFIL